MFSVRGEEVLETVATEIYTESLVVVVGRV